MGRQVGMHSGKVLGSLWLVYGVGIKPGYITDLGTLVGIQEELEKGGSFGYGFL